MINDKSFRLDGKIALVTGASYGIGFSIASAMAEAGATIVFNDIKQELVDKGLMRKWEFRVKWFGESEAEARAAVKQFEEELEMKPGMIELLVVLLIVVVIFGPTQIPKLTKMIGKSIKNLRAGMAEDEE